MCDAAERFIVSNGGQATLRQIFDGMTYLNGKTVRHCKGSPNNPQALAQYLIHDKLRRFKNIGGSRHSTVWAIREVSE